MDDEIRRRGEEAAERLQRSLDARDAEKRRLTLEGVDLTALVREKAAYSWTRGGVEFWLKMYYSKRSWCGYARFASRPVKEPGYKGILVYVPVHGGITYAQEAPNGSFVYGFDCGHASDSLDMEMSPEAIRLDHEHRMKKFMRTRNPRYLMPEPKRRRLSWLVHEVEGMAAGIRCAARVEDAYNAAAESQDERAKILDQFHAYLAAEGFADFDLSDNFLALINVLAGSL